MSPSAYFDTLSLGNQIAELIGGVTRTEIHLFAYAACLLSIYEAQPAADWGYELVSTENGLPFSPDIDEAIDAGLNLGLLSMIDNLLVLTQDGKNELSELKQLEESGTRERYLSGATDSLLVFNPGNVREAFNHDPTIAFLRQGRRTDWLLTTPIVDRLYANFQQLKATLSYDAKDLTVPMVGWLKYLIQEARS